MEINTEVFALTDKEVRTLEKHLSKGFQDASSGKLIFI